MSSDGPGARAVRVLVVQHRGIRAGGDDRSVGQLAFALAASGEEGLQDVVFAAAGIEARLRGAMTARAGDVRQALLVLLPGRLARALVVQPDEQPRRVHRAEGEIGDAVERLADERRPRQFAEDGARLGGIADRHHLELRHPGLARQRGRLVPVVARRVEQQPRPLARPHVDEASRRIVQRCPPREVWIHAVGIRLIVQEGESRAAGMHDERLESLGCERGKAARVQSVEMVGKQHAR